MVFGVFFVWEKSRVLISQWCLHCLPSPCLLHASASVLISAECSVFIQQAHRFQKTSHLCTLTDWLCHLPPASTAAPHVFINVLGAWRGVGDTWTVVCVVKSAVPCPVGFCSCGCLDYADSFSLPGIKLKTWVGLTLRIMMKPPAGTKRQHAFVW